MGSFEKGGGHLRHSIIPETAALGLQLSECTCEKILAGDMHVYHSHLKQLFAGQVGAELVLYCQGLLQVSLGSQALRTANEVDWVCSLSWAGWSRGTGTLDCWRQSEWASCSITRIWICDKFTLCLYLSGLFGTLILLVSLSDEKKGHIFSGFK